MGARARPERGRNTEGRASFDDGWDSEGWSELGRLTPFEQEQLRSLFEPFAGEGRAEGNEAAERNEPAARDAPKVRDEPAGRNDRADASAIPPALASVTALASGTPVVATATGAHDAVPRRLGRPRKPKDEKLHPRAFRLCSRLEEVFKEKAREEGFRSWQEWLRAVGEKEARRPRVGKR